MKKLLFIFYFFSIVIINANAISKLTFNSINVGGITFKSTPADLILLYPDSRIIKNKSKTQYLVDGLNGFDYIEFTFENEKLVHILSYKSEGEYDEGVSDIVQTSVRELSAKYGNPEIQESSYEIPSYNVTSNTRFFRWYGEVFIKLEYKWNSDNYGQNSYGTISIDYVLDITELF